LSSLPLPRLFLLAVPLMLAWGALSADEIAFKDGTKLRCEVFKVTDERVHYIDPAKERCLVAEKKAVFEIHVGAKPVVDLKAFLKKHGAKLSTQEKADLAKALQAEDAKKALGDSPSKPAARKSRLKIRGNSKGVTVRGGKTATPELTVDAFADDDEAGAKDSSKKNTAKKPATKKDGSAAPTSRKRKEK